jgi:NAD(P)H-dependent FMN reductase
VSDSSRYGEAYDSAVVTVVGLVGSLRATSTTRKAVRYALRGAEDSRAQVRLLDLGTYDLPLLGRERDEPGRSEVERFQAELGSADGYLFGSPELHGSFSGVLKNAIDLADRETFSGKMLGLIGVAGGRLGAGETLSHLRAVARSLRAWVVPTEVSIAEADRAFGADGAPIDHAIGERLVLVGRQVAHFARLHKCGKHLEFLKEMEGAAVEPG